MIRAVCFLLALGTLGHAAQAQERCRQALALALDVSGSVDSREYRLQLDGLAAALSNPKVHTALLSMPDTPVRLAVYEWSSPADQTLLVPWRAITSEGDLNGLAAQLRSTQRTPAEQSTGLGTAMLYGAKLLARQSECWVRTLDISGDGKANTGPLPQKLNKTAFDGITINALVIGADALDHGDSRQAEIGELSSYFNAYVIHGPSSFVEVALGFDDYERAMVRKLLRELEGMALSLNR
ncbi:MAG: DUF1194 domain-containing protein [Planktotalea sp.]|uniref:DUF1194 domain-containing protein n=1 Tax=Planktotalea sp. TaxID=2029877 RepID=UPI003C772636